MQENTDDVLVVKDLCKNFYDFSLKNVSFSIPKGSIMGFIGANGSGKTTTIKLIMQLLKKDAGEINLFGQNSEHNFKKLKERIGFVYDDNCFYQHLSIKEMTKILAPFYKNWDWDLYNKYISQFELNENKKIAELSKGSKTKYSLATALSHKAEFIIMDEPSSGLDPIFRRKLLDVFYDVTADEQCSIFFSTHITTDLEKIADYITFINNGKIIFSKIKDDVYDEYAIIKGGVDELTEDIEKNAIGIKKTSVGFEGLTNKKTAIPKNILMEKPTLEDIMFYYATTKGETK